ncbi:response regulator transcription factor [Alteromonas oceanisediminis]|uniref:response regulator transcription factor n=1 Tax=Alteromonas oceanisediminis TaxID=2836180 RepID=UPI001BD9CCC7|nr:response regulator transcription factor [Alteromonas oceanisediminis]MBT0585159.1 response regulator transcription factor [Alteromonas oceanisediminis]
MYRILLVDDQMLVRSGIKSLLSLSPTIHSIEECSDGEHALDILRERAAQFDVVLLDIRMPRKDGISALQELRAQGIDIPVLMLTTFDEHSLVLEAIQSGANGYLLKDVSLETLTEAITTVANGGRLIQPAITERLLTGLASKKNTFDASLLPEPLSPKEQELLRLMAAGCSNREMAEAMFKSEGTIKNQVSSILNKLGVRDRTRAVLKSIELGII